ncbi:MAG: GMC family oxidoreductase N-terminal domain-containing protein [Polyangiales bacterium]
MARPLLEDVADFVIVGTGAGGATAARVLSEAGLSVLMLEEGPELRPDQRPRGVLDAMTQSMRALGTLTTAGSAPIPLLQGRCVGGSTAVNSGIIWRTPDDVRRDWSERFGLGELVQEQAQGRIFAQLESELEIGEVDAEVRGGNALLMHEASRALGLPGRPIHRNAKRCKGSARCLQGCPNGARQSMDVSYVPRAQKHGARLLPLARALRIVARDGRAHAVEGELLDERRRPRGNFRVVGRRGVIVAAGAVHTPLLLLRSGIRRLVGDGFQAHPGAAVVGRFAEPVGMGYGAVQAYEVPLPALGMKLESLSLPPELLASRLPGAGAEWQRRLHQLEYFAQWAAVVRMRAVGRVRRGLWGGPRVDYEPTQDDFARLKHGTSLLVRMMFAVGAVEVYPGVSRLPQVLTRPEQAELLLDPKLQRRDFHLVASHHFGTARAGADPQSSVVSPSLECHDLPRLFVMDASALPTNLGVNPQHTIMAVVFRAAEWLANEGAVGRAAA